MARAPSRASRRNRLAVPLVVTLLAGLVPGAVRAQCEPAADRARAAYREVSWRDFQGPRPQRGRPGRGAWDVAVIATSLRVEKLALEVRREGPGSWIARARHVCVQAYMHKDLSGVRREDATASDLAHEQGHFDITRYFADVLRARLLDLEHRAPGPSRALDGWLTRFEAERDDALEHWKAMQARYDADTDHSRDRRAQRRWAERIRAKLRDPVRRGGRDRWEPRSGRLASASTPGG